MNAVDTNILIYARDPRDPRKQQSAQDLIATLPDVVLLWQVACEYIAAARKLERLGYDQQQAWFAWRICSSVRLQRRFYVDHNRSGN
jgi:predicted nucleic acid-binding protein